MVRGTGKIVALAVTTLIGLAACQPTPPEPTTPPTTAPTLPFTAIARTPPAWTVIGGDEFDGSSVDASKWKLYNNTYGDGNNELACLTPGNVTEAGGTLSIVARNQPTTCPGNKPRAYTSGFLGSRETGTYYPMYAKFEIRAKVPHAQGMWPAFWLRHRNGASTAEIDVLEYFHARRPGQGSAALHLDGRKNVMQKYVPFELSDGPSAWHVWAVEISPTADGPRFDFSVDGQSFSSYVDTQHQWTAVDPAATWDIAINQAVGGDWTGEPDGALGYLPNLGRCSISGTAPGGCTTSGIKRVDWNDPASTTYEVDWVRVSVH